MAVGPARKKQFLQPCSLCVVPRTVFLPLALLMESLRYGVDDPV